MYSLRSSARFLRVDPLRWVVSVPKSLNYRFQTTKVEEREEQREWKDWAGQNKDIIHRGNDWKGLLRYADEQKDDFNDVNWATMFSRLGRMRSKARVIRNDEVFNRVRSDFERRLEESGMKWLGMQAIGNILHAYGVMGIKSDIVYESLENDAERIVEDSGPHEIGNCMYAVARLGYKGERFVKAVETEKVADFVVSEGNPQAIGNIAWSLARLSHEAPNFAAVIDKKQAAEYLVSEGLPQNISNTIWAMAILDHQVPVLAQAIEKKKAVRKIMREGDPREICVTLWAMAKLGHRSARLARAIEGADIVEKISRKGNMQDFSNALWALSQLRYKCPRLVKALEVRCKELVGRGSSQSIANTAWALANLGYFNKVIFEQIGRHAKVVAAEGTQEISNTLWSFAVAGLVAEHEGGVRILWGEVMKRPLWEVQEAEWRQLEIVRLFAKSEGVVLDVLDGKEALRRRELLETAAEGTIKGSETFELSVVKDLSSFGFNGFERELSPFDNGDGGNLLKIDIAWGKEKVALELDGPSHFLRPIKKIKVGEETTQIPRDGPTKAKKRLLEKLGWKVWRMSHFKKIEYDKLGNQEKMHMWATALRGHGIERVCE